MEKWDRHICALSKTMDKYHQESYAVADCEFQSKLIFLQRTMKETGQAFTGLKKFLRETFLSRFFFGHPPPPPIVGALSTLTVKKSGMGLQNPVMSAKDKYTISLCAIDELIGEVKGEMVFSTADHIWEVKGERRDEKKTGHCE